MKVDSSRGGRPLCIGEGSGGHRGPQRGIGAEPRWRSRGQTLKQNEFDLLTFTKLNCLSSEKFSVTS